MGPLDATGTNLSDTTQFRIVASEVTASNAVGSAQAILTLTVDLDAPANLVYAGGHDLADPYLSPLFGDFTKGFPPTLLRSGTRDLFLSNTVRMHAALRAADVPADLHVIEAATHIMFFACREGEAFNRQLRRFLDQHWSRGTCHSIVNNEGEE